MFNTRGIHQWMLTHVVRRDTVPDSKCQVAYNVASDARREFGCDGNDSLSVSVVVVHKRCQAVSRLPLKDCCQGVLSVI